MAKYLGMNTINDGDFRDAIKKRGIAILSEKDVDSLVTWDSPVVEVRYLNSEDGQERYAYLVTHRWEVDSWAQESYIFDGPVERGILEDVIDAHRS
jgi:hypothetical protein